MNTSHPKTLESFKSWIHTRVKCENFCYDFCLEHLNQLREEQDDSFSVPQTVQCDFPGCNQLSHAILAPVKRSK
jgi:hypothetical protein